MAIEVNNSEDAPLDRQVMHLATAVSFLYSATKACQSQVRHHYTIARNVKFGTFSIPSTAVHTLIIKLPNCLGANIKKGEDDNIMHAVARPNHGFTYLILASHISCI